MAGAVLQEVLQAPGAEHGELHLARRAGQDLTATLGALILRIGFCGI